MGRIRTIKPEFFSDEELSSASCEAHLLAASLLCYVDDEGYFNANPGLVKAGTVTLRNFPEISGVLAELARINFVRLGKTPEGKTYGQVIHFTKHQRVSHPTPSKIKDLPVEWEGTPQVLGKIPEDSREIPEPSAQTPQVLRPEGKGNGKGNREGEWEAPPALAPQRLPSPPVPPEPAKQEPPVPVQADVQDAEDIPDGLALTQYGNFILEELRIAAGYGLRVKVSGTVGLLALEEACSHPEATRRLLARMHDAQVAGPVRWNFWLEDGNWKQASTFSIGIEDPE